METDTSAETNVSPGQRLYFMTILGFFLIVAGFSFIIAAISSESGFGGVIFIGPFPIAFGFGPSPEYITLISFVIVIIMILLFLIVRSKALIFFS